MEKIYQQPPINQPGYNRPTGTPGPIDLLMLPIFTTPFDPGYKLSKEDAQVMSFTGCSTFACGVFTIACTLKNAVVCGPGGTVVGAICGAFLAAGGIPAALDGTSAWMDKVAQEWMEQPERPAEQICDAAHVKVD